MSYSASGRFSSSTNAFTIATTSVDEAPRPLPTGTSECVVSVTGSGSPPRNSFTIRLSTPQCSASAGSIGNSGASANSTRVSWSAAASTIRLDAAGVSVA